jgi:glutathione S-transferase
MLAYNGLMDKVELNGADIPYPGTDAWKAFSPKSYMGQLPCLNHGDVAMGQSAGILRYLARLFKLYDGCSMKDFAMSEQLIEQSSDFHNVLSRAHYAPDRTKAMDDLFKDGGGLQRHLSALEAIVGNAGSFAFSSKPMPGDLAVAAALSLLQLLQPEVLSKYPKLKKFSDTIAQNDGIKALEASTPYQYFKRKSD